MTRISLVILIVLGLMVAMVVQAQTVMPLPLPERTVGLRVMPGEDGRFYVFCTGACERLLDVADVSELYASFETNTDAHNHGLILMARLNGGVPVLLPGTSLTAVPSP